MGFRIKTGGSYASKKGNDANSGLSPSLPKQTIAAAAAVGSGDCVVLAGTYVEDVSLTRRTIADGIVNVVAPYKRKSLASTIILGSNMIGFAMSISGNPSGGRGSIIDCTGIFNNSTSSMLVDGMIIIRSSISTITGTNQPCRVSNVMLISSTVTNNQIGATIDSANPYNSVLYIDFNSSFHLPYNPSNVCCNGIIIRPSNIKCVVPQAIDFQADGYTPVEFASRQGVYPTGAQDWLHNRLGISAQQCYQTNRVFNVDPQFNDPENLDFTVKPTSPFVDFFGPGQHFLNVKVATSTKATAFSKTNLQGTDDLEVAAGQVSGYADSSPLYIDGGRMRSIGVIQYGGNLSFDSLATGGSELNDNVPKALSYTKNGVSETSTSPRPSVLIRWTQSPTQPTQDTHWTNEGATGVLPGEWVPAELNTEFYVDGAGYGNGDHRFAPTSQKKVQAVWYQLRVQLLDNYNY